MSEYYSKYLKYKIKYYELKGGGRIHNAAADNRLPEVIAILQGATDDTELHKLLNEPDMSTIEKWAPIFYAIRYNSLPVIEELLYRGVDLNIKASDEDEYTPLHLAVKMGDINIVKALCLSRANTQALTSASHGEEFPSYFTKENSEIGQFLQRFNSRYIIGTSFEMIRSNTYNKYIQKALDELIKEYSIINNDYLFKIESIISNIDAKFSELTIEDIDRQLTDKQKQGVDWNINKENSVKNRSDTIKTFLYLERYSSNYTNIKNYELYLKKSNNYLRMNDYLSHIGNYLNKNKLIFNGKTFNIEDIDSELKKYIDKYNDYLLIEFFKNIIKEHTIFKYKDELYKSIDQELIKVAQADVQTSASAVAAEAPVAPVATEVEEEARASKESSAARAEEAKAAKEASAEAARAEAALKATIIELETQLGKKQTELGEKEKSVSKANKEFHKTQIELSNAKQAYVAAEEAYKAANEYVSKCRLETELAREEIFVIKNEIEAKKAEL